VPSAGGPDIYAEESCPDGTYVRAITEDGRELWRRNLGGSAGTAASGSQKQAVDQAAHLDLSSHSLCDDVSSGMTRDAVAKRAEDQGIRLQPKERESNSWTIENRGSRCSILFDGAGIVVKKKKTIVTD